MAAIAVRDSAVGIPEGDQARVFDHCRQLDSLPARGDGKTGLGLSIGRRAAVMLAGTIDLDSTPGRGTMFRLRVPAHARRR